ncbi:MAG: hypothetical protein IJC39_03780, partial [Firmicutes bacterium]|nr:hypothetical protein [Bacillota bacterium]
MNKCRCIILSLLLILFYSASVFADELIIPGNSQTAAEIFLGETSTPSQTSEASIDLDFITESEVINTTEALTTAVSSAESESPSESSAFTEETTHIPYYPAEVPDALRPYTETENSYAEMSTENTDESSGSFLTRPRYGILALAIGIAAGIVIGVIAGSFRRGNSETN